MFEVALPQEAKQSPVVAVPPPFTPARTEDKAEEKGVKPRWRGIPDVIATLLYLPAAAWLMMHARPGAYTAAALVYSVCLIGLFSVSGLYHSIMWSLDMRRVWRRIDHSMVYVMIAGSYTPVVFTALDPALGTPFLTVLWTLALLGAGKSFFWETAPRWLNTGVYIVMGWLIVPLIPSFYRGLGPMNFGLIVSGGVIYTVGALVYARKWPNPDPKTFGYHEVFHLFVVAAAAAHYVCMWNILT